MAEIPVNSTDAFVIVDVTAAGQAVFDFDFRVDQNEDLKATYTSPLALSSTYVGGVDFTATGLGSANGGTITFVPGLPFQIGGKLTIYRDIVIERTADYTQDLFADDINREMDIIFMILQEFARDITRTFRAPMGVNAQIPSPLNGNLLGWNAQGQLVNFTPEEVVTSIVLPELTLSLIEQALETAPRVPTANKIWINGGVIMFGNEA